MSATEQWPSDNVERDCLWELGLVCPGYHDPCGRVARMWVTIRYEGARGFPSHHHLCSACLVPLVDWLQELNEADLSLVPARYDYGTLPAARPWPASGKRDENRTDDDGLLGYGPPPR